MNVKGQKRGPGRPRFTEIDKFQTLAWFETVAYGLGSDKPFQLERKIQPEGIKRDADGKLYGTRMWDNYKAGVQLPRDGFNAEGRPYAVLSAAKFAPESLEIYRHPIWIVMRAERMVFETVVELLNGFDYYVKRFYLDLESTSPKRSYESFVESIGLPIWIDRDDDLIRSLDHLSVQLMILRMDNFRHTTERFECIAENIMKTLGPISTSPWLGKIHREFFDWLEKHIWKDIFDSYELRGNTSIRGWRKTKPDWIIPSLF